MTKPIPPTKAMLAAIGLVASESSRVEELMRELYCYLIDSPYGRVITAGEDMSNLSNSCLRVARYNRDLTETQIDELVALIKAIDSFRPLRNFLIHARWERAKLPGQHVGLRSSRAPLNKSGRGIEEGVIWLVKDAEYLADCFLRIAQKLEMFIEKTFDRPPYVRLISRDDYEKIAGVFSGVFEDLTGGVPGSEASQNDSADG